MGNCMMASNHRYMTLSSIIVLSNVGRSLMKALPIDFQLLLLEAACIIGVEAACIIGED